MGDVPNGSVGQTSCQIIRERESLNVISRKNWEFMRHSFYQISLQIFGLGCLAALFGAYYLFQDFVKPLMWAIICGITLYPLKKNLTQNVKRWLDGLLRARRPLVVGLITCPVKILDNLGDFLVETIHENRWVFCSLVLLFPLLSLLLHFAVVPNTVNFVLRFLEFLDTVVYGLASGYWIFLLIGFIAYTLLSKHFPQIQISHTVSRLISSILWFFVCIYMCNRFGPFRAPLFLGLVVVFISYLIVKLHNTETTTAPDTSGRILRKDITGNSPSCYSSPSFKNSSFSFKSDVDLPGEDNVNPNLYLKWVTIACVFVYVSQRLWLVFLVLIPLSIGGLKRLAYHMDISQRICSTSVTFIGSLQDVLPGFINHFCAVLFKLDKKLILLLRSSMDMVGSVAAMGLLAFGIVALSGFVAMQLYYESLHLVNLGSQLANQTLSGHGQIQSWFQNTSQMHNISQLSDYVTEQVFTTGKNYLSNEIRELVRNDEAKAVQLELHIAKTLDALYTRVTKTNVTETTETSLSDMWTDFWGLLTFSNSEMLATLGKIVEENMQTWWSVGETLFGILWNSSELIIGALSIIFTSGSAIMAFVMDLIVFLTFLLTLLCGSDDEFMPMKFIRSNLPSTKGRGADMVAQVEQAVSGVFLASLKIAIFYGLLTWLTHTIFAVQLVFVPSVLAAIFAAVPFLGTYFAAFPAILEIWLIRGEPFQAVLLFLIHVAPGYFVDDVIYSEIKSTNSFVTGMAIAGGMLWWGLEGAIFGPIILCVFIVMGKLYQMLIAEQENVPSNASDKADGDKNARQRTESNDSVFNSGTVANSIPDLVPLPLEGSVQKPVSLRQKTVSDSQVAKMKRFSRYSYHLDYSPSPINPAANRQSLLSQ